MRGSSMCCQKRGSFSNAYKDTRSGLGALLTINPNRICRVSDSLSKSNWDFFGIISSIWAASKGYVSTTLFRIARCTDDFTLDFAPAEILRFLVNVT